MPIRDVETARALADAADQINHPEADDLARDMRALLKLIATQLEDSDRQQSQVLAEMQERLEAMGNEARLSRAKVSQAYAPAFERLQEGIELLAEMIAERGAGASASIMEPAEGLGDEPAADVFQAPQSHDGLGHSAHSGLDEPLEAADDFARSDLDEPLEASGEFDTEVVATDELSLEDSRPFSDIFATPADDRSMDDLPAEEPLQPDRSQEQAADSSWSMDEFDDEPLSENEFESGIGEPPVVEEADTDADCLITDNAADRLEFERDAEADAAPLGGSMDVDFEASADPLSDSPSLSAEAPQEAPVFVQSIAGDTDEPWDAESAEALTRIYETSDAADDADVQARPLSAFAQPAPTPDHEQPEPHFETGARPCKGAGCQNGKSDAGKSHFDQSWLEARFAEIAAQIEESFANLKSDPTLRSEDGSADTLAAHLERVELQIGRLDSVEQQLESILGRLSDDRLMSLTSPQGGMGDLDLEGIANAAAEGVAQRFLADMGGSSGESGPAVAEMREALDAFMAERREHDHETAGMLDTIQQALIRVLDRVDVLEGGYQPLEPSAAGYEDPSLKNASAAEADDDDGFFSDELMDFDDTAPEAGAGQTSAVPAVDQAPVSPAAKAARPDYSQRLEYPAAVMGGMGDAGIPQSRPAAALEQSDADFNQAAALEDAFEVSEMPAARNELDAAPSAAGTTLDLDDDDVPTRTMPLARNQEPAGYDDNGAEAADLSSLSPIERLRQEFIADAKRAQARAAEQALLEEAEGPKKQGSRLAVPGLSGLNLKVPGLGKGKANDAAAAPAVARAAGPAPQLKAPTKAAAPAAASEAPKSRFQLPRTKLLVGAVIVLFATAGALLMLRDKGQPIDAAAPPAIEETGKIGTGGPEIMEGAPATGRRSTLDEGRIYDGDSQYDVPPIHQGPLAEAPLDGVAVAGLENDANPAKLASAQRRQHIAQMSSDLGAAAAYATPAHLLAEEEVRVESGSVAGASTTNHLNLPPATVGPLTLRLAAAKGDPSAQFEVAARLAGGTGTPQDLEAAVKWYRKSAAQGFAQAQYRLGTLYERGIGVGQDKARASVWYEQAAAKGNVKAMHNLAVMKAGNDKGGPDYNSASRWFAMAAEYGLSDSQFNMAVLHENGLGVEKDLQKAYVFYALAARSGDEQAEKRRDEIRAKLSPSQVTAGERQIQVFRPKRSDKVVNDARTAGEDWKKRADNSFGN